MIGFLGGTGPEGKGLALRMSLSGQKVLIGSRSLDRAKETAQLIQDMSPNCTVSGALNKDVALDADVLFITVPYEGQCPLLLEVQRQLIGKIVINTVAPMTFSGKIAKPKSVNAGSAAKEAQELLPGSYVVAAFQNTSATDLIDKTVTMEGDVLVCSDHPAAKQSVMSLVETIPNLRPVDSGSLENAKCVEHITPLLININRIYKTHSTIKILNV